MSSLSVEVQPRPPAAWHELARRTGRFYDDPRWIEGIATCFRYPLFCLTAVEGGSVVGGLALAGVPGLIGPSRLVSLPFSYVGGPIDAAPHATDALCNAARQLALAQRVRRVEIKRRAGDARAPAPGFVRTQHYSTYRVATAEGEAAVWKRLHPSSTQRSILKGQKAGVAAVVGSSEREWLTMATLQEGNARRHGVPAPPRRFFVDFCRSLQREGLAELYLATLPDQRVAAGLVVWKGACEWIYAFGASDGRLLEHRPNHVLLWTVLRHAVSAGVEFDLGRAAPEQTGLVEFKRRWGGEPMPLAYDYWPVAGGLNVQPRDRGVLWVAARTWSVLPHGVTRLASLLYRYLG